MAKGKTTFLGSIGQGTTSTKFIIYDHHAKPIGSHQVDFTQFYPHTGWVEQDPMEILESVRVCIAKAVDKATVDGHNVDDGLKAIGLTNQRETTLLWDKTTGLPLHNVIVWMDVRTSSICCNSEIIGNVAKGWAIKDIPITGCLGDQHAAMVGQACLKGEAKSTYGTGAFILLNTGEEVVQSKHGLMLTLAFKLGPEAPPNYAIEGSIAIAGAAVQWLRDSLRIIGSASEIEKLASEVETTVGVYFVPALNGLFAPWRHDDARGVCIGIRRFTTKAHIARAVLEGMCFQVKDVLDSMHKDTEGNKSKEKDFLLRTVF